MAAYQLCFSLLFRWAAGHGAMYEPPSRNGYGMSLLAPTCPGGSCQWYNQGCEIGCPKISETQEGCAYPVQPRLKWGEDDYLLQYKQDGYGGTTEHHPWRYPGSAPVKDACGLTAGGTAPLGQLDPPPGFTTGVEGKRLPQLLEETTWVAGSVVEVAWGIAANHGGGYQYRLCPANEDPTEDQWLQFGNGYDPANRIAVKARRVGGEILGWKVVPEGSTWTMNPIPGCKDTGGRARSACSEPTFTPAPADDRVWRYADGSAKGIFGYGGGHCFGNLTKKPDAKCSLEEYRNASFDFGIVDRVKVPNIPEGQYVLSWRWDCEMTKQIWTNCADITIKTGGQSTLPFSPIPGCSVCCGEYGMCANCSQCLENKEGGCAYCWKPLPWWEGRTYWTPRAKAIQCLGREGPDGGPGEYVPGDSLEEPWSPGCTKCWSHDSCAKYQRPLQAARTNWMFITAVVLVVGTVVAGVALFLRKKAMDKESREVARASSATDTPVSTEMT